MVHKSSQASPSHALDVKHNILDYANAGARRRQFHINTPHYTCGLKTH